MLLTEYPKHFEMYSDHNILFTVKIFQNSIVEYHQSRDGANARIL